MPCAILTLLLALELQSHVQAVAYWQKHVAAHQSNSIDTHDGAQILRDKLLSRTSGMLRLSRTFLDRTAVWKVGSRIGSDCCNCYGCCPCLTRHIGARRLKGSKYRVNPGEFKRRSAAAERKALKRDARSKRTPKGSKRLKKMMTPYELERQEAVDAVLANIMDKDPQASWQQQKEKSKSLTETSLMKKQCLVDKRAEDRVISELDRIAKGVKRAAGPDERGQTRSSQRAPKYDEVDRLDMAFGLRAPDEAFMRHSNRPKRKTAGR
eukprot:gnl/MRDRNA2_/MRDRNA2_17320_c0_seq1.p1 gnl/MRDRNA2_/MRDRNA2_17320_c0~~gnl/MRDRNA2_/MRDRNA2_17320_c0_seq1.p1  ORF type:complete len:266 (+),score=42.62 gnl/MRDRNA2_/MRDRNA2_17320_c0_seq1:78-875(+)